MWTANKNHNDDGTYEGAKSIVDLFGGDCEEILIFRANKFLFITSPIIQR